MHQPDVSYHIKELEEYFGLDLFQKDSNDKSEPYLTPAGETLLRKANKMIAAFDGLHDVLQPFRTVAQYRYTADVRVMSIDTVWKRYWITEDRSAALRKLFRCFDQTELIVPRAESADIEAKIAAEAIDFGFIVMQATKAKVSLDYFLMQQQHFVAVLPTRLKNKIKHSAIGLDSLFSERWFTSGQRTRDCIDEYVKTQFNRKQRIRKVDHEDTAIEAVRNGSGVAIIPEGSDETASDLPRARVSSLKRQVALVWSKKSMEKWSDGHHAFLAFVKQNQAFRP